MFTTKKKAEQEKEAAFYAGYRSGFGAGIIYGKAEALGQGCILEGTKLEQEVNEIMKKEKFQHE